MSTRNNFEKMISFSGKYMIESKAFYSLVENIAKENFE